MGQHMKFLNRALGFCLVCFWSSVPFAFAENANDFIHRADSAFTQNDYKTAEGLYEKALQVDPNNYRVMKSLADIKIRFKKWKEAGELTTKILALPVSHGKKVRVFWEGQSESEEAEIVDETVVAPPQGKDNMRNYIEAKSRDPIPHYRMYFPRTGKVELVPKKQVRIEFIGVPRRDYYLVKDMDLIVQKELIALSGPAKIKQSLVALKGGCFKMGSEKGNLDERPVHEVCLDPFKIDKYEVTQADFQKVMGTNPSQYTGAELPVDSVTWFEADQYCKNTGKRLPSEAEWEFAARAGSGKAFYTGDTFSGKQGNFCDEKCALNIKNAAHNDGYAVSAPVGAFPPNGYNLFDMAGNLSEWTNDWMLENFYSLSPKDNPKGPPSGGYKIIRGGAWNTRIDFLRSAKRNAFLRDFRNVGVGFRCAAGG